MSSHARETAQKSVSLTANPPDLPTMTMYWYIKYWSVKNITESFTLFVLFFLYVLKYEKKSVRIGVTSFKLSDYGQSYLFN